MRFGNPTALHIGMSGDLSGQKYRVVGRVVMGMDDNGETYYWNEFNIVNDAGEHATLIFEDTERGGEWKLFTMFEPEYPMTAEDAATRRVGDELNLEGSQVSVTLVDESRVYYIEGEAPEGVEVGDVAHYFNAEAANTMIVVSWTGSEVEFFRGMDLPRGTVARAFGLPAEERGSFLPAQALAGGKSSLTQSAPDVAKKILPVLIGLAIMSIFAISFFSCKSRRSSSPTVKIAAPRLRLPTGSAGKLDGRTYRIRAHALVEVTAVGSRFDRHEYFMADDEENSALLIHGLTAGAKDFMLFIPLEPVEPFTPERVAALRVGDIANVDGVIAPVKEMFQSTISSNDGETPANVRAREPLFGFIARTNSTVLLVRWTNDRITFHRGRTFPEKVVSEAFSEK
jgi:hypothetical protein